MKRQFYGLLVLTAAVLLFTSCNNNASMEKAATDSMAVKTDSVPKVTDNWKLGVQLWTFRMFTMTEALQKVDSCGIKYVEAFWGQALGSDTKDTFGISMSQAGRDKLKELLKSHNIQMVAMGVIAPATKQEWIDAFKLAKDFNLCKEAHCDCFPFSHLICLLNECIELFYPALVSVTVYLILI